MSQLPYVHPRWYASQPNHTTDPVNLPAFFQTLSEKPFMDIAVQPGGNTIVAASTDRTVSAFDLRLSNTSSAPIVSLGHSSLPSTLAAHPTDDYRVMSGSYDGIVRIWDLRSPKVTLAHLKSEKGGKILSVDWSSKGIGALGGEDGVEIWKIGEGTQSQSN